MAGLYYAGTTWTGLVVKNTYVESQKFNDRTAALRQQKALGWDATFIYREGFVVVDVVQPLAETGSKASSVMLKLGRPVQEGEDRVLQLHQTGIGQYSADVQLQPGLWEAHVLVRDSSEIELLAQGFRFVVKE